MNLPSSIWLGLLKAACKCSTLSYGREKLHQQLMSQLYGSYAVELCTMNIKTLVMFWECTKPHCKPELDLEFQALSNNGHAGSDRWFSIPLHRLAKQLPLEGLQSSMEAKACSCFPPSTDSYTWLWPNMSHRSAMASSVARNFCGGPRGYHYTLM